LVELNEYMIFYYSNPKNINSIPKAGVLIYDIKEVSEVNKPQKTEMFFEF